VQFKCGVPVDSRDKQIIKFLLLLPLNEKYALPWAQSGYRAQDRFLCGYPPGDHVDSGIGSERCVPPAIELENRRRRRRMLLAIWHSSISARGLDHSGQRCQVFAV